MPDKNARAGSTICAAALVAGIAATASSPAMAAGFWVYEMGTPDLGTAAAGRAALAKDAATVFGDLWLENNAGVVMHLKAKREGLMLSLGADVVDIRMDQ